MWTWSSESCLSVSPSNFFVGLEVGGGEEPLLSVHKGKM